MLTPKLGRSEAHRVDRLPDERLPVSAKVWQEIRAMDELNDAALASCVARQPRVVAGVEVPGLHLVANLETRVEAGRSRSA